MSTFRKRIPDILRAYLGVAEIKRTQISNEEIYSINEKIKEAKLIDKTNIDVQIKKQMIIELFKEIIVQKPLSIDKVIEHYISTLDVSYKEIIDRRNYIFNTVKNIRKPYVPNPNSMSTRTYNKKLFWLRHFYNFCIVNNYIDSNPILKIPNKKDNRNKRLIKQPLSLPEIKNLINSLDKKECLLVKVLYLSGMRLSEFFRCEIDYDLNIFDLRYCSTKNVSSKRIIPIHSSIIDEPLLELQKYNKETLARKINKAIIYDNKSLHSLRHSFTTDLIQQGINSNIVSELLGHSHDTVTMNRYFGGYNLNVLKDAIECLYIC